MKHCTVFLPQPKHRMHKVRLFKSMGFSHSCIGFGAYFLKDLWGKLEPLQLKVHREWLILFHIRVFFFSTAKEPHTSVVCPCCLLGKEYLSPSDRCWHYHPHVLPGTGTRPAHKHGLRRASWRRQRQTAAHRFRISKIATLILDGAEDDVIIMVLIPYSFRKKWISAEHALPEAKKRKGNWQA